MTDAAEPLVEIAGVSKHYGVPQPLRIQRLAIQATDRLALAGLDAGGAETLINLITGAAVPDEGTVRVAGRDTRDIATDTEWLASLDRFGIVTARAVLIGKLTVADNLALPLTLSIDPISPETRATIETLADLVALPRERLAAPAATLAAADLFRVHLARALAPKPLLVLLERPTAGIADRALSRELGQTLRDAAVRTGIGWLAISDDAIFVDAAGGVRRTVAGDGRLSGGGFWSRWVRQPQ